MATPTAPESRTIDVDVQDIDTRGRTIVGYAAVYGATAQLDTFSESIAPGAFADVVKDLDCRCLLNHDPNVVLGRTKSGTLRLADDQRGLRFEVDLPESRQDLREAVARGDLDGASFRFRVGDEQWDGEHRTITKVAALHDVTLATYPAYPDTSIELRTRQTNDATRKQDTMDAKEQQEQEERHEVRSDERPPPAGSLRVEERASVTPVQTLTEAFRSRGFPSETSTIGFDEFRTTTFGGTIDVLNSQSVVGGPFGFDQRWAWQQVPQQAVTAGVTSVDVFQQTARTLVAGTATIRAIDATTNKPEAASTLNITNVPLKQVAAIQSGIPNVHLEQPAIETVVEQDLRFSVYQGLDELVRAGLATSANQAPGTDNIL